MPNRNQVGASLLPMIADVALTAGQAVVIGSAEDHVTLPAAANDQNFIGFAVNDALQGESVSIQTAGGVAWAIASAAIVIGKYVQIANTSGQVATAAPAAGSNAFVVGKALRAAGALNDIIPVLVLNSVFQG